MGSHAPRDGAATAGPGSVLLYGEGFGTIVLAQTTTTPELEKQFKQLPQTSQILGATTVDGAKALKIGTPLGGVIVWQKGEHHARRRRHGADERSGDLREFRSLMWTAA